MDFFEEIEKLASDPPEDELKRLRKNFIKNRQRLFLQSIQNRPKTSGSGNHPIRQFADHVWTIGCAAWDADFDFWYHEGGAIQKRFPLIVDLLLNARGQSDCSDALVKVHRAHELDRLDLLQSQLQSFLATLNSLTDKIPPTPPLKQTELADLVGVGPVTMRNRVKRGVWTEFVFSSGPFRVESRDAQAKRKPQRRMWMHRNFNEQIKVLKEYRKKYNFGPAKISQ